MKSVIFVFIIGMVSVHGRVTFTDVLRDAIGNNSINEGHKHVKVKIERDYITPDLQGLNSANVKKTCMTVEVDEDNRVTVTDNVSCAEESKVDNGTALLLSPLIEEGRTKEANNASRVDPELFLGLESYSGYLTVDKIHSSHIFFWYFPALRPVNDTPWIIWLQGGPGVSSLTGLFNEIGPFTVDSDGNLKRNPFTWLEEHSLVFIDNPVGTGYSFTEHPDGYVKDMDTYGKHLYSAVRQLVQVFPSLRVAPLFVAGESYAGKYVPALAAEIHRHKDAPGADINLKGLLVGNAYIQPSMFIHMVRPFIQFGLVEKEQEDAIEPMVKAFHEAVKANKSIEAKEKWNKLIYVLLMLSHQKHAYNFLRDEMGIGGFVNFLHRTDVKRALHVGDIKYSLINVTVKTQLEPDFLSSAQPLFEELLEHYKVLAYCGQLDQMLPCVVSSETFRSWQWGGAEDFRQALRHPLMFNDTIAGYVKSGGGLTWVVVRGAGHMVPVDAPGAAQRLATLWTHDRTLPTASVMRPDELVAHFTNLTQQLPFANVYL